MEAVITVIKLVNADQFSYDFILLVVITATSMALFLLEWVLSTKSEHRKKHVNRVGSEASEQSA